VNFFGNFDPVMARIVSGSRVLKYFETPSTVCGAMGSRIRSTFDRSCAFTASSAISTSVLVARNHAVTTDEVSRAARNVPADGRFRAFGAAHCERYRSAPVEQ
jgi:hypothetical protein